ncbi:uncharacterized protein M421DRAFT_201057 [Didymella exigua CBS 183.55]|uniref:Uncharacterized protein n=1 Tax=Didymella exigua CBS 183.55 TaxID=1150837 RepID=A0A6A5S7W1_9PLEO|nr:uncharacterized protein M421DRAFT_201057 [Didymella exigua CBS 183.55]KAF1933607.1 hypothetical protein M421DRAFT_201057 [Didymella exigua CBS 183.55]
MFVFSSRSYPNLCRFAAPGSQTGKVVAAGRSEYWQTADQRPPIPASEGLFERGAQRLGSPCCHPSQRWVADTMSLPVVPRGVWGPLARCKRLLSRVTTLKEPAAGQGGGGNCKTQPAFKASMSLPIGSALSFPLINLRSCTETTAIYRTSTSQPSTGIGCVYNLRFRGN